MKQIWPKSINFIKRLNGGNFIFQHTVCKFSELGTYSTPNLYNNSHILVPVSMSSLVFFLYFNVMV